MTSRFWCPFLEHIHLPLCHWYSFILKLISITLDPGKNCLKFFFVSCSLEQRSRLNVRIYLCCHLMVSFFKICAHGLFTYQNDLTIPASTIKHFFSFLFFEFFVEFFCSKWGMKIFLDLCINPDLNKELNWDFILSHWMVFFLYGHSLGQISSTSKAKWWRLS